MANTAVVYGRDYAGKTLNFEASGGLSNASLIMQDQQTDSYWSIMQGVACTGKLKGEKLNTLPLGEKTTWKSWREKHPKTKVLTFRTREDGRDSYGRYFTDQKGFRGLEAKDQRLETKSPIFALQYGEKFYAAKYEDVVEGSVFDLAKTSQDQVASNDTSLFLFRAADDDVRRSTTAFCSKAGFTKRDDGWVENASGATFDVEKREFVGGKIERVRGFDTYWYNWSLNNPSTEIIQPQQTE